MLGNLKGLFVLTPSCSNQKGYFAAGGPYRLDPILQTALARAVQTRACGSFRLDPILQTALAIGHGAGLFNAFRLDPILQTALALRE